MSDVALASQGWGPTLCRGLYEMWKKSVNCDTVIYSNNGQTYNAHASVLMASSPYLNRILCSKKKQVFSVEIETISSAVWEAILKFIYSGEVNVERSLLESLLDASEKLEIRELSHQCLQQLNNQPLAQPTPKREENMQDMVQNLSMKKEDPETPHDLSVKRSPPPTSPALPTAPIITVAPQGIAMMGMPQQPMWIPQQMPWAGGFPQFHPNMIPQGQMPQPMAPPFMSGSPNKVATPSPIVQSPHSSSPSPGSNRPHSNGHSSDEDKSKKHVCRYCNKRFKLRHVLQQHELTHTNHKPYYCDICGFRARQKAVIWKHKKLKHGKLENVPIRVSKDDGLAKFPHIDEMSTAMNQELNTVPLQIAEDPSPPPMPLAQDRMTPSPRGRVPVYGSPLTDSADRQFICKMCNKSFRNKHVLAQHELTHSTFRPYACTYCDFRAKQKAVIWRHNKVKHANKEVSYTTETVPRSPGGSIIEPTQPEEPQEPPIQPDEEKEKPSVAHSINNVLSRLKTSLTSKRKKSYSLFPAGGRQAAPTMVPFQHQSPVTLTGYASLFRFQCKTCHKMFKNKHILLQHELVHSSVRPYKCQYCNFRAKQKAVMWRHNRSRHPEKGRQRIVEDIDLTQIRESSAADFERESMDMQAMNSNLPQSPFDEDQENHGPVPEGVSEDVIGNGVHEEDNIEDEEPEEDLDDLESDDENEGDEFFCQTCGKGFSDEDAMEQHKRKHVEPLTCDICGYRTRVPGNMEKHKERKHTKKVTPTRTDVNTNYIPNPGLLPQQPSTSVEEERRVLMAAQDIRPSMTVDGKKLFYCNYCSFCTAHQTSLSRHKRLKHDSERGAGGGGGEDNSQAESGDEATLPVRSLPVQYNKPASPAMPAQLINFCMQQNPAAFQQMFHNAPILPMPMHLQNQQPQSLQAHDDADPKKKFQCPICLRRFKHRHVLKQHSLVHTDEKPYKCEYCPFRGRQKASLWRHRRKHLEEMERQNGGQMIPDDMAAAGPLSVSPAFGGQQENGQGPVFPGNETNGNGSESEEEPDDGVLLAQDYADDAEQEAACGGEDMEEYAEDVQTDDRQDACVVPTADGKYACSLCGHVLASKMSLQRHCNTHKTGKCYKCQECGYETPYGYTLQRHINTTHGGDKTYSCDQCEQSFKQNSSLVKHKQTHHSGDNAEDEDVKALQCDETME